MSPLRLLVLSAIATIAQLASAQSTVDTIRGLDSAWGEQLRHSRHSSWRAILAEDIAITATNGSLKSREDEIGDVRPSPGFTVDYFRSRDANVRMFGGQSAIVTGLLEWSTRDSDRANIVRRRYTAVYVRGGPLGWKMVALHIGRSPD